MGAGACCGRAIGEVRGEWQVPINIFNPYMQTAVVAGDGISVFFSALLPSSPSNDALDILYCGQMIPLDVSTWPIKYQIQPHVYNPQCVSETLPG